MKVCLINNIYPPYDRGGAEQVVQKIAEGLLGAGHQVVIITSSPKGDEFEDLGALRIYRRRPFNLYFYTDGHKHVFAARFLWHCLDMFNLPMALWVRNILKRERPDVVHTHNLMGLSFLIPKFLPKPRGLWMHTVHDTQLVEPSGIILKLERPSFVRSAARKAHSLLTRFLIGSPEIVISPSQFLLDFYVSRGFFPHSKQIMLRNPVTFDLLKESARPAASHPIRFLYVGQIEEHKGVLFLIRTFLSLVGQCELHVVGNGSLLESVRVLAASDSRIRVYGRLNRQELAALFPTMDVLIVPSLCYENSPTVIFESMASGVPILASNIEGIAELITQNENGRTFVAGDTADLQRCMRDFMEHPNTLLGMRQKTPEFIRGLSQKEYIEKLGKLYRSRS